MSEYLDLLKIQMSKSVEDIVIGALDTAVADDHPIVQSVALYSAYMISPTNTYDFGLQCLAFLLICVDLIDAYFWLLPLSPILLFVLPVFSILSFI